ncbi:MAG: hypothetical protein IT299_13490 [Dehalococcoidia bacterium]|nr:hypothetical protein [Dehalococcoidia bacterium]
MTTNADRPPHEPVPACRVYTGPDGHTHVEAFAFPLGFGSPSLSALVPVEGVIFRRTKPELDADFHPAPRRQFVITIQGEGEIETSDGTLLPLGPGSIVLVEDTADTNGRGHITRGKGTADRLSLFIPVPADWQPPR